MQKQNLPALHGQCVHIYSCVIKKTEVREFYLPPHVCRCSDQLCGISVIDKPESLSKQERGGIHCWCFNFNLWYFALCFWEPAETKTPWSQAENGTLGCSEMPQTPQSVSRSRAQASSLLTSAQDYMLTHMRMCVTFSCCSLSTLTHHQQQQKY